MEITVTTCLKLFSFILELPEHVGFRDGNDGLLFWFVTWCLQRGSIWIKALEFYCFRTAFPWKVSGGEQELPTKGQKTTWVPCLAVPRTALWQQVNPFTPGFPCFPFPLYSCPAYWEREIYECLGDTVVQATSLKSLNEDENPTFWLKASCCRDL